MTKEQIAAVFTEWQRRYREDPSQFRKSDPDKESVDEYGDQCSTTFLNIYSDLTGHALIHVPRDANAEKKS